jgi:CheY-like chemotaxis protein
VPFIAPQARILIVDDINTNLSVATGLLALYQMQIDTSLSGSKAINMVKEQYYDIILMDHMMPEMDGIEAAVQIRDWEHKEKRERTPIIALTANAVSGMKELFLSAGFDDFLSKPIEIPRLDEIVDKWIPGNKKVRLSSRLPEGAAPGNFRSAAARDARAGTSGSALFIAGVDVAQGIALTGGSEAGYRTVVSLFYQDARERLPFLVETAHDPSGLEGAALESFIIQVHALKSAMATIGARDLSAAAARLEKAGRERDAALLNAELGVFTEGLTSLTNSIAVVFKLGDRAAPGAGAASLTAEETARYRDVLLQLRDALAAEDSRLTDRLLETLQEKPPSPGLDAIIARVEDKVLLYEFAAAAEIIGALYPLYR